MRDKDLYARILNIEAPWRVADVELNLQQGEVVVHVEHDGKALNCPECGQPARRYDRVSGAGGTWIPASTARFWLPSCRGCSVSGTRSSRSRRRGASGSRFTALFEALVIDWLREANTAAVAQQMGLSWDEVDGIMQRAVQRGLERREVQAPQRIGVDETSFQKRHEYVTVVNDLDGHVLHVADGRGKESLEEFYKQFDDEQLARIQTVADMWEPYIRVTTQYVADAQEKIAFDKFHVAGHLGDAVDRVRRAEHRRLAGADDQRLKGSRYRWLMDEDWEQFAELRDSALQTARARTCHCGRTAAARGRASMAGVVPLGDPLSAGAGQARGAHDQAPSGRDRDRRRGQRDQRPSRINAGIQKVKYSAAGSATASDSATPSNLGGLDLYPAGVTR